MADLPKTHLETFMRLFYYTACDYFDPYKEKNQQKQDRKALWSHLHLPEHKSSAPGTGCRLFYNGIYADAAKILCYQGPTSYDVVRQQYAVSWHRM